MKKILLYGKRRIDCRLFTLIVVKHCGDTEVEECETVFDLLDKARDNCPDLIVLLGDTMGDYVEHIKSIKKMYPNLPVVISSKDVDTNDDDIAAAFQAGISKRFTIPFISREIEKILDKYVNHVESQETRNIFED